MRRLSRSVAPRVASATVRHCASPPMSATEFARLAPLMIFRRQLQQQPYAALRYEEFARLATEAGVEDPRGALAALSKVGLCADGGDVVHVKPVQTQELLSLGGSGGSDDPSGSRAWVFTAPFEREYEQAAAAEAALRAKLDDAVARASRWRKLVWGSAAALSGAQLAAISRLTFFDLDWDIMEPVSYFIGTGTSIAFYLFLMVYKREHTYSEFDRTFVLRRLRKYAPADFDWAAYDAAIRRTEAAKKTLDDAKAFAATH